MIFEGQEQATSITVATRGIKYAAPLNRRRRFSMPHLAPMLAIASALALLGPVPTKIQARAEAKLELAVDCPRRAVYRGEILQVVARCKNLSSEPAHNTPYINTATASIAPCYCATQLLRGQHTVH